MEGLPYESDASTSKVLVVGAGVEVLLEDELLLELELVVLWDVVVDELIYEEELLLETTLQMLKITSKAITTVTIILATVLHVQPLRHIRNRPTGQRNSSRKF